MLCLFGEKRLEKKCELIYIYIYFGMMRFHVTCNDGEPMCSHQQDILYLEDDEMIVFPDNIAQYSYAL